MSLIWCFPEIKLRKYNKAPKTHKSSENTKKLWKPFWPFLYHFEIKANLSLRWALTQPVADWSYETCLRRFWNSQIANVLVSMYRCQGFGINISMSITMSQVQENVWLTSQPAHSQNFNAQERRSDYSFKTTYCCMSFFPFAGFSRIFVHFSSFVNWLGCFLTNSSGISHFLGNTDFSS